jgi:hypothetical protein
VFPDIDHCLVCDLVRPEPDGKISILGFLGACPDVVIRVRDMAAPVQLTFVLLAKAASGTFRASAEIIDVDSRRVIQKAADLNITLNMADRTALVVALPAIYPKPGSYGLKLTIDGQEKKTQRFGIATGDERIAQ